MAALLRRCGLESVLERRLGVRSRFWIRLGLRIPVGLDAVPLRLLGLPAYQCVGMATRWILGGMERAEDRSSSVELCCTSAPVFRSKNCGCKPRPDADATGKIVRPDGNPQEFGWTRNPPRRHQEPEPVVRHGSAAGICHGKSSN